MTCIKYQIVHSDDMFLLLMEGIYIQKYFGEISLIILIMIEIIIYDRDFI